jgi:acyl carrier protein
MDSRSSSLKTPLITRRITPGPNPMTSSISNIRQHILTDILNDPSLDLAPEQDLLLSGMLDSVSVMRLISWLENEYQISVPAEDVLVEHFGSLNQIKQYLDTRISD